MVVLSGCIRSADDWADRGDEALRAFKLDDAERMYQRALKRTTEFPRALYGLGWVQHSRRDTAAARLYFERCVMIAPDFYGGYRGMGSVHLAMGFYDQAEQAFQKALSLNPQDAGTHGSLGYVYLLTRRLESAEREFVAAVAADPSRGETRFYLAELRARQGRYDDALQELEKGMALPFIERKFLSQAHQLQAQLLLKKAVEGLGPPPWTLEAPDRDQRLARISQAEGSLAAAEKQAFSEELRRIRLLREKISLARERLSPGQTDPTPSGLPQAATPSEQKYE